MRRILRLLIIHTWREFLQWMAWRTFLITLAINQAITPLIGLAVWSVALPGSTQITTYYVALLTVQLMTVSYEHHTFSNGIYAGALNHDLLRPVPVMMGPLGTNIAMRIWHLLIGLPLIILVGIAVNIAVSWQSILLAIPAIVLAATLRFLFTYLLALSALWTERAHSVVGFGETLIFLLGGSAAPVTLFPENLRVVGEALPFWGMLGFPAAIASNNLTNVQVLMVYGWQVLWIVALALTVALIWRVGIRRYTAVGG
jgi:ABC-2 type transport system permease protein